MAPPQTDFVTHLEAAIDGTILPSDQLQTTHHDRPLWVRYDLDAVKSRLTRETLRARPESMWRYRELLPYRDDQRIITLGETMTPLLSCDRLATEFGLEHLFIKDESQLPTGSFKSRGQAMAVTMALRFGVTEIAIPTAGNAGGALAAYGARAGIRTFVFMPKDTPVINQIEARQFGAKTYLVDGLITDCGKIVREGKNRRGWFDMSTLKEPYRIEGKKTMGLELAEQCDWKLPDVILYPTGGGTGLIGMWKAFNELRKIGWLESETMPRMVAVQSDGCCPIVRAFEKGDRFAEPFINAQTVASGLRVPAAVGDFMIIDAIRESNGTAVAVTEQRLNEWMSLGCSRSGIGICPETAACIGALDRLVSDGWIRRDERVVIFNTGAMQKYPEAASVKLPTLDDPSNVDYATL